MKSFLDECLDRSFWVKEGSHTRTRVVSTAVLKHLLQKKPPENLRPNTLLQYVLDIQEAFENKGPAPHLHDIEVNRLKTHFPLLYKSITSLLKFLKLNRE